MDSAVKPIGLMTRDVAASRPVRTATARCPQLHCHDCD